MNWILFGILDVLLLTCVWYVPKENTQENAEMIKQVQEHCIPVEDLEKSLRSLEKGDSK